MGIAGTGSTTCAATWLDPAPRPATPAIAQSELTATVRGAVRPFVHALDADSGGLYLLQAEALRFAGAFGVPGELRLAESFRDLLTIVVDDVRRIADLEARLARIAELSNRT